MRADLHTHSILSDGSMIPAELVRRAYITGHSVIAITDHVDSVNVEFVVSNLVKVADLCNEDIKVIPGVEITHVAPSKIADVAKEARSLGAEWIVVHGETIAEPVAEGTNLAAANNPDIDLLAHPGFLTEEAAQAAVDNDVLIEITGRMYHNATNGYVASVARRIGAKMVVNSDTHSPNDLLTEQDAINVSLGAGLTLEESRKAVNKTPFDAVKHL
ncbi:MAG TPA: histidinol phosphate phosphatase domain-containing protein [Candidatus Methanomethylophilaceae archaeon]|nr:histidinol phosphate phosphatase domain-containing protein [Candidatus Methanomethylophilaceae archaeon]